MSNPRTRIPSPARSMPMTPRRRETPRKTRSVCSPARSIASGRLSCIIREYREQDIGSMSLSPMTKKSVLTDNTDIEELGRKSWWRDLGEASRDVMEVLKDNNAELHNIFENIEVLSQEEKHYTLDLSDSDNESIQSIVIPQRKWFLQKENQPQKKIIQSGIKETLDKLYKPNASSSDKTISTISKELFQSESSSGPVFPAALLDISSNTTASEKTMTIAMEKRGRFHNLFGNQQSKNLNTTKHKNMFAQFIASDSEDDEPEIRPKFFALSKPDSRRPSVKRSSSRGADTSMTSSMDIDDWHLLPSSTMVDLQINASITGQAPKKSKLSKLLEVETATTSSEGSKTKKPNKSISPKNNSKIHEKSPRNTSIVTRNSSKILKDADEAVNKSLNESRTRYTSQSSRNTRSKNKSAIANTSQSSSIDKPQNAKNSSKNALNYSMKQNDDGNVLKTPVIENLNMDADNKELEYEDDNNVDVNGANLTKDKSNDNISNKEVSASKNTSQKKVESKENRTSNISTTENDVQKTGNNVIDESAEITRDNKSHVSTRKANEGVIIDENINDEAIQEVHNKSGGSHHKGEKMEVDGENNQTKEQNQETEQENNKVDKEGEQKENTNEESEKEQNIGEEKHIKCQEIIQNKSKEKHDENQKVQNDIEEENNKDKGEQNGSQKKQNNGEEMQDKNKEVENEAEEMDNINDAEYNKSQENNLTHEKGNENKENNECQEEIENETEEKGNESEAENNASQEEIEEMDDESEAENNESEIENETEEKDNESEKENESEAKINESKVDNNESQEDIENEPEQKENESEAENNESQEDIEIESQEEIEQYESEVDQETEYEEENDQDSNAENDSDQAEIQENDSDQENAMACEDANDSAEAITENYQNEGNSDDQIENTRTPNVSHDTTGRKSVTPKVVLRKSRNDDNVTHSQGRNISIRKTKSINQHQSREFFDGSKNSSNEGSGWDSHRITRKTLRQTFGKDLSMRKSLRAMVIEKSAKARVTAANDASIAEPQANSTEFPEPEMTTNDDEMFEPPAPQEVSIRTRQATIEECLEMAKRQRTEENAKVEEDVKRRLEQGRTRLEDPFKIPTRPLFRRPIAKPKTKAKKNPLQHLMAIENLPEEFIEDLKYKPPKRFAPRNAAWLTKRLYKYLETKLEPKYDYKARVRAERFAQRLHEFVAALRRRGAPAAAPPHAVDALKHEMARLNIVKTHFDFYNFFHDFMPREVRVKVIPDIVNKISHPRAGVFSDILLEV